MVGQLVSSKLTIAPIHLTCLRLIDVFLSLSNSKWPVAPSNQHLFCLYQSCFSDTVQNRLYTLMIKVQSDPRSSGKCSQCLLRFVCGWTLRRRHRTLWELMWREHPVCSAQKHSDMFGRLLQRHDRTAKGYWWWVWWCCGFTRLNKNTSELFHRRNKKRISNTYVSMCFILREVTMEEK